MLLGLKRPREMGDSPMQSGEPMAAQASCSPHRCGLTMESPTSKRTRAHEASAAGPASSFMCGGMSPGMSAASELSAALQRQRVDPQTGEVLFTLDQVKDIVRRAVDEKERQIREQYDRILQQKLQEQYQAFAKFNEDYISRSLKTSDLGYIS